MYHAIIPATHLFLIQGNDILLLKRANTGFYDGHYSVPAGHVEVNESIFDATIREGYEELGITISRHDMTIVQVIHRKSSEERVDFFLHIHQWQGELRNHEPQKCEELRWTDMQHLPQNTVPYIRKAIENYTQHIHFDVYGWEEQEYAHSL